MTDMRDIVVGIEETTTAVFDQPYPLAPVQPDWLIITQAEGRSKALMTQFQRVLETGPPLTPQATHIPLCGLLPPLSQYWRAVSRSRPWQRNLL